MIEAMLAMDTPVDVILVAVRAIELSRTNVPDIQEYERTRKRAWRNKTKVKPEANDAGIASEVSRNVPDKTCELSSLLTESQSGNREVRKKNTDGVIGRAKGTRLDPNSVLNARDYQFALEHGVKNPDAVWAEFVDYWIAVPGQRGTKLNWSATWRNRVRDVGKGRNYGQNRKTLVDIGNELVEQARDLEYQAGIGRPTDTFRGD
jgi:hypothetical protein